MERLATSVDDAAASLGIGRTKLYELISYGALDTMKIGRRTLITLSSLNGLVAALTVPRDQ